jgi:hypothetical protein
MDLKVYVDALRQELAIAAEAGGEEAKQVVERLTGPIESAIRLVIQDALSDAAQELTRDLAPGSVELRLRGRELVFVITPPPDVEALEQLAPGPPPAGHAPPAAGAGGDTATSRISFRPPEHLKSRIEDVAERAGLSVNAFLVKTLESALQPGARRRSRRSGDGRSHFSGWVR